MFEIRLKVQAKDEMIADLKVNFYYKGANEFAPIVLPFVNLEIDFG